MKKNLIMVCVLAILLMQLCGCQANPKDQIVSSKNDGVFDANVLQTATEGTNLTQITRYTDQFNSTDGSIEFAIDLNQTFETTSMPVVEVVPRSISGEDVKRVAEVLLEDAVFYERESRENPRYSKTQIQKNINRWSQYANSNAMKTLYEDSTNDPTNDIDYLKRYIELFTEWYESAPDENPHSPCNWQFKKERQYNTSAIEIGGRDISEDSDVIFANTEIGEVEYILSATTRNKDDYIINDIDVGLGSGIGPIFIDMAIYKSLLCRTAKPSDEQVSTIASKAQNMLDRMDLGDWVVDDVFVEATYFGETPEYVVVVNAVPTINGVKAIYGQEIPNITGADVFTSNYPISVSRFEFSANADLIYFQMTSPITIKETVNSNVATLSIDSLLEKVKVHLSLSDATAAYGLPTGVVEMYEEVFQETINCKVYINEIEYGLGRVRVAESNDSYYYIPVLVCKGTAEYYGVDSGTLYVSSNDYGDSLADFVWMNAIDGTIIEG